MSNFSLWDLSKLQAKGKVPNLEVVGVVGQKTAIPKPLEGTEISGYMFSFKCESFVLDRRAMINNSVVGDMEIARLELEYTSTDTIHIILPSEAAVGKRIKVKSSLYYVRATSDLFLGTWKRINGAMSLFPVNYDFVNTSEPAFSNVLNTQAFGVSDALAIAGGNAKSSLFSTATDTGFSPVETSSAGVERKERARELQSLKRGPAVDSKPVDRAEIKPASGKIEKLMDLLEKANARKAETLKEYDLEQTEYDFGALLLEDIAYTASFLIHNWTRKANHTHTGRQLFKRACRKVVERFGNTKDNEAFERDFDFAKEALVNVWAYSDKVQGVTSGILRVIKSYKLEILFSILEDVLNIKDDLVNLVYYGKQQGVDVYGLLCVQPYALGLVDPEISIHALDKLYAVYVGFAEGIPTLRNSIAVHNLMTDANSFTDSSTLVPSDLVMRSINLSMEIDYRSVLHFRDTREVFVPLVQETIRAGLNKYFNSGYCRLVAGTVRKGRQGDEVVNFSEDSVTDTLNKYIVTGFGVTFAYKGVQYIADTTYLEKEIFIHNKVYSLNEDIVGQVKSAKAQQGENEDEGRGGNQYGEPFVSEELVNSLLDAFEEDKAKELGISEFKLEQKQRQGALLLNNGVIAVTGGAGCGKTTATEALIYVLLRGYGLREEDIRLVAPTGKAAVRLRACSKRKTSTIHSLIMSGGRSLEGVKALIVDEMSMVNIDLLYSLLYQVEEGTRVIFIGDREQLPAIGFGKPFVSLLSFLPTTVLNVSKRATKTSLITQNANSYIETEGFTPYRGVADGEDFSLVVEKDSKGAVVDSIVEICKYHLRKSDHVGGLPSLEQGNYSPDDIQVISPVKTKKYAWGCDNLNNVLQNIFNPLAFSTRRIQLKNGKGEIYGELRVGDRVYQSKNDRKRERYVKDFDGALLSSEDKGIVNGDIGKIVGICTFDEVHFSRSANRPYRTSDATLVVTVEYEDVSESNDYEVGKFLVLYTVDFVEYYGNTYTVMVLNGIETLCLAYALTVHKLQGCQSRLVIGAIYPVGGGDFISRNMVYTLMTRASNGVYLVGDVGNAEHSTLSRAQKLSVTNKRRVLLDTVI